ncbi:MAG: SH3 domain-containing protein [Anaerolineae bacterium]|nr:SH3 domain-containing protein [Anaerolineae bacterium]
MPIPLGYEIPPNDVLQQIAFYLGGGDGSAGCERHCLDFAEDGLLLYRFEAKRSLRILIYKQIDQRMWLCDRESDVEKLYNGIARYIGEWNVVVDSSGSLKIEADVPIEPIHVFVIVDPRTGEVLDEWSLAIDAPVVPGGGWTAGQLVRANTGDSWLNIYSGAGYDSPVVAGVPNCGTMVLTGPSQMIGAERWWPVRVDNGMEGWASELWLAPATVSRAVDEKVGHFELNGFQVPPVDVLQQIAFYPAGGGRPCSARCLSYDGNKLVLSRFDANRSVRIVVCRINEFGPNTEDTYGGVCRFVTEWNVIVDGTGNLALQTRGGDLTDYQFVAVDADSGEILGDTWPFMYSPVVLDGGWTAGSVVKANPGQDRLNIRNRPGYSSTIIAKVHHGDKMTIRNSPRVVKGERWWPVRLNDGTEGWVTELWIAPVR